MTTPLTSEHRTGVAARSPWLMLAIATIGFAVNFWAWALISPLGPLFRTTGSLGSLTESDVALLVAVPVVVGSLGRIPLGALTDRFGGRVMFPIVSLVTIVPVLFLAFVALDSYACCWSVASSSASPAPPSPSVSRSSAPGSLRSVRGFAIGIFGAGMGGTAISALTTVKLVTPTSCQVPVPDHRRASWRCYGARGRADPARRSRPERPDRAR